MSHVHRVVMDKYLQEHGVEGNTGVYMRVQKLKELLAEELTPEIREELTKSPNNKILVVMHSRILQAFHASGISENSNKGEEPFINSRFYQNCEMRPYKDEK